MPRDGNGNFTRTNGSFSGSDTWVQQANSVDKTINSGRHDVHDQDMADALSGSVARDGQAAMTGNLPMAGNRIVNLGAPVANNDAAKYGLIATGSTAESNLADRAARRIDVIDDGAVGNGTTNNDAAFAAAEARRVANGWKKSHVPEGNFLVTTAPDWSKIAGPGNVLISGDTIPAGEINETIQLRVPSVFPTIESAWDYLKPRQITMNGLAQILVADGTYNLANRLRAEHPNGARISMLGNTTTPANVVLNFTHGGSEDGIFVGVGYALGFLNGFEITLPSKAASPNVGVGIVADTNGTIICGQAIRVRNFYFGIAGRNGGHVRATGAWVRDGGDTGIIGFAGGSVSCENADVADITDAPNSGLGTGILGEAGGVAVATGATATGCQLWQIAQANDGHVRVTAAGATGTEPRVVNQLNEVQARGQDGSSGVDADLTLAPLNNGVVLFKQGFTPNTGLSPAGSILMKIGNGTTYRIMLANV